MRFAALILVFLPYLASAQELIQVCDPANFAGPSDPPLPNVPNQFSATIEGNLLARSQSFVVTEYYDQANDRGKIEFTINGTRTVGIYDYNLGEVFIIPDPRGGDCRVFEISPSTPFLAQTFGFTPGPNGTLHIGSPAAFLERIQENATTRYMGQDNIRGVPVHRWQSCVALPNNSYLIDYYFASQANWTYGTQLDSSVWIPIQFSLNASFYSSRRNMVDNAYNVYTFVDYQTGPNSIPDDIFTIPTGLACLGRKPGQPVPTLSNYFSARVELRTEYQGNPVLVTLQEYYDFERGLFGINFYDRMGPTTRVHDFNQGVEFLIRQTTNKCSVTPLSELPKGTSIDFDPVSDSPSLASPNQFALLDNSFNYSYEGVSTVRGIEVDSWVSVRDFESFRGAVNLTNAVYEVFLTRPGVTTVTEHSVTTVPVVVRVKLSGTFFSIVNGTVVNSTRSFQFDLFDVSTQEPHFDVYDVSTCYAHEDIVSLVLEIPGQLTGFDIGDLRENIRVAVSDFTKVSPLQIASINVNSNGTFIYVHLHIANMTTLSTIPVENRVTAAMALQKLLNGTAVNAAPRFTFVLSPNNTVTPSIRASGQGRGNPSECPTAPAATTCPANNADDLQNQLKLKDRELIGVAIGLLFGGILIGGLLTLLFICICRCVCKSGSTGSYNIRKNVKYQKHDDDVAFPA